MTVLEMTELDKLIEEARTRTLEIVKFSKDEEERGLKLHKNSIVIDSLLNCPLGLSRVYSASMIQRAEEMVHEGRSLIEIKTEIEKMGNSAIVDDPKTREEYAEVLRRSGVTCASRSMLASRATMQMALNKLSQSKNRIDKLRDVEILATCAEDIKHAKKEGKHAILWVFQDTTLLGGGVDMEKEIDNIDFLYGLGVRVMQLTYNLRNFVGDGCYERYESGLSHFGIRVVERMNKLGMLVDVSHCGYQTTLDAAEASKVPIAANHTTCKALHMHKRGKTDEELKAIAEKGGCVGICQIPGFLSDKGTIKEFLDHVDYAVNLIGVDHVSIGTDTSWPQINKPKSLIELEKKERKRPHSGSEWWRGTKIEEKKSNANMMLEANNDESKRGSLAWVNWPYFTVSLVSRGYSDSEIKGIIGKNILNLYEKVIG